MVIDHDNHDSDYAWYPWFLHWRMKPNDDPTWPMTTSKRPDHCYFDNINIPIWPYFENESDLTVLIHKVNPNLCPIIHWLYTIYTIDTIDRPNRLLTNMLLRLWPLHQQTEVLLTFHRCLITTSLAGHLYVQRWAASVIIKKIDSIALNSSINHLLRISASISHFSHFLFGQNKSHSFLLFAFFIARVELREEISFEYL